VAHAISPDILRRHDDMSLIKTIRRECHAKIAVYALGLLEAKRGLPPRGLYLLKRTRAHDIPIREIVLRCRVADSYWRMLIVPLINVEHLRDTVMSNPQTGVDQPEMAKSEVLSMDRH